MATAYFIGKAAKVSQVTKVVYSSIVAGQSYSVTINGKAVSYVALTTSLSDLMDGMIAAWNSSGEPEHQEMVAAQRIESSVLVGLQLTGTSGIPITVTAAATTGTATVTTPTAASGPNFWNVAANWLAGSMPSAGDTVVVSNSGVDILYGLTDTTNYAIVIVEASYTGAIGLPATNTLGYPEYRTRYLTLGTGSAINVQIGYGIGNFGQRLYLDVQGSNVTLTVYGSSSNAFNGYPVQIIGMASGSTVNIYGGSVQLDSASTSTVSTLNVLEEAGTQSRPNVRVTDKVTATTILCVGGVLLVEGPMTTLTARDSARVSVAKASAAANVKVSNRAQIDWESSGGITTKATVEPAGILNFGNVGTTKTVAACDLYTGGVLRDPNGKVTWTAGIVLIGCRIGDVTVDKGVGVTI